MCPSNMYMSTDEGSSTAPALWKNPNATDNSGHVNDVTCTPQARSLFPIGQTMVTCRTMDDAGNIAECYFYVNVSGKIVYEGLNCSKEMFKKCLC